MYKYVNRLPFQRSQERQYKNLLSQQTTLQHEYKKGVALSTMLLHKYNPILDQLRHGWHKLYRTKGGFELSYWVHRLTNGGIELA